MDTKIGVGTGRGLGDGEVNPSGQPLAKDEVHVGVQEDPGAVFQHVEMDPGKQLLQGLAEGVGQFVEDFLVAFPASLKFLSGHGVFQ
jgi:hypothetical protein